MIDIEQMRDRFRVSHFGKDGEVEFTDIAIPKSEKYRWELAGPSRKDPFYQTWDGKPVKKVRSNWLSKFRVEEFFSTLPQELSDKIFEFNQPNVWFCDIEVEVTEEFPDPNLAATPILTVALVNSKGDVTVTGLKDLSSQQIISIRDKMNDYFKNFQTGINFQYIKFESESEMLYTLFNKWFKDAPLLTGWNFVGFDWKYLINRARKLGIDASGCSVNGEMKGDDQIPIHKIVVDYLDLYKRWDRVIKVKENNKLDTVANAALGLTKIKYSGTFMDLYNTDFETYVYYNAVDTFLVYLIDQKLKTLQTFLMLGNVTRVEAMKAFSPIWMTEAIATRVFYSRKRVVAEIKKGVKNSSFEGAYVKQPKPGLYEAIATFDFASLYPSTMRQWNISPETFKGKGSEIEELQEGWIRTASGAIFDNTEDSVFRSILTEYYSKRKESKGKSFELAKEIDYLEKKLLEK
jgi:DNA polymerase elongation subunit (family B)